MKNQSIRFMCFFPLFLFVLIASTAFSVSVDRIVLVKREPDVYIRNVSARLNTKTGQTLVVFEMHPGGSDGHSVWGQLLQPDGKPAGNRFLIIPPKTNPIAPRVVYDPDTNQFVLVYVKRKQGEFAEVYAIRLKPNGRKKGNAVLISPPHNPAFSIFNFRPFIFYDSENKNYVVFFERFTEGTPDPADPKGIYGAILSSDLSIRKQPAFVEDLETGPGLTFGPFISDVVIHAPTGKLLLSQTLDTPVTFTSECFVALVDRNLQTPATIKTLSKGLSNAQCSADLIQVQGGQTIALFSQDDGTKKRKINSGGDPAGPSGKFFAEPVRSTTLGIIGSAFASSNALKEIAVLGFVSSEIEEAQFWLQLANAKGKSVGPAIEIESGVDCRLGGTISALPAVLSSGNLYAVLYIQGERDQPPLVNQGSGLVLLRVNSAP